MVHTTQKYNLLFIFITVVFLSAAQAAAKPHEKIHPALNKAKEGLVPVIIEYEEYAAADKPMLRRLGCKPGAVLKALHGIAAECPADALAPLSDDDNVVYVWEDEVLGITVDATVPLINATAAWAAFGNGTGINVSILDTGINTSHPGLAGQVVLEQDFTTEGTTDDLCNHGTPVACVVGCADAAYKGVAPSAKLFNAKVGKVVNPDPLLCGVSSSDLIEAIDWSVAHGAQVLQISIGSPISSCYQSASAVAVNNSAKNITIVVSAGNGGPDDQTIYTPGCAENAITVGASNGGAVESYSSRGPTDYGASKPDLVAPGTGITAATNDGASFSDFTGTSFASPHVSGVAALMLQQAPLTPAQVKQILKDTAIDLGAAENAQGAGRVDAHAAVQAADNATAAFTLLLQPDAAAGKDAFVSSVKKNKNYGASDVLKVQGGGNSQRALMQWAIASIPSEANIVSAIMTLFVPSVESSTAATVNVHRVTAAWTEGTGAGNETGDGATWNMANGSAAWANAGGDYDGAVSAAQTVGGANAQYPWDITGLVSAWHAGTYPNNGLILVTGGNVRKDVAGSDHANASNRPMLQVNYTL